MRYRDWGLYFFARLILYRFLAFFKHDGFGRVLYLLLVKKAQK